MISANELRIGNRFIREIKSGKNVEYDHDFVLTEEWMGKLFGGDPSIALQDLYPIPLTPEILDKCGARKEDESFYNEAAEKIHKSDSYYWKFPAAEVHVRYMFDTKEIFCWLKYEMHERRDYMSDELRFYDVQFLFRRKDLKLHQFQNIVFALTAEELKVSL